MPSKLTVAWTIGAGARAAASLTAPATGQFTATAKKCPSFTDPNRAGVIHELLGTQGGVTCAQGAVVIHPAFAHRALPFGMKAAFGTKNTVGFVRTVKSSNQKYACNPDCSRRCAVCAGVSFS